MEIQSGALNVVPIHSVLATNNVVEERYKKSRSVTGWPRGLIPKVCFTPRPCAWASAGSKKVAVCLSGCFHTSNAIKKIPPHGPRRIWLFTVFTLTASVNGPHLGERANVSQNTGSLLSFLCILLWLTDIHAWPHWKQVRLVTAKGARLHTGVGGPKVVQQGGFGRGWGPCT